MSHSLSGLPVLQFSATIALGGLLHCATADERMMKIQKMRANRNLSLATSERIVIVSLNAFESNPLARFEPLMDQGKRRLITLSSKELHEWASRANGGLEPAT